MIKVDSSNFSYTGTSGIQDRYFASQKSCSDLITGLFSAVHSKDPNAVIAKSDEGGTGFTFLCTVPSYFIKEESEVDTIPAVLKWQNETRCKVEQYGARVFRHLGFRSPPCYFFDAGHKTAIQLMKTACEKAPAMESLVGTISCLVMPRFHSNNLSHVAKKGEFFKLEETDQKKMIHEFGRITAVDLLIGNDDRFIKFPTNKDLSVLPSGCINSGNILLHIHEDKLQAIFPIDNCPSARLLKKERISSGGFDMMGFSIFDDNKENVNENSVEEALPIEDCVEKTPPEEDSVEPFHRIFVDFHSNPEKYVDQFTEAFLKKIRCPKTEIAKLKPLIKAAFLEGIEGQLSTLTDHANSLREEAESWDLSSENVSSAKRLFVQNLKFLEGQK